MRQIKTMGIRRIRPMRRIGAAGQMGMTMGLMVLCLIISLLTVSCQKTADDRPVPRREGYPRIEQEPIEYVTAEEFPLSMEINKRAFVTTKALEDGGLWADASLPQYGAMAYYTFTPVNGSTIHSVISNRLDRMLLNLGEAEPEIDDFTSAGGARVTVITAMSANSTPVQFVAALPQWVVSGSVFMPGVTQASPVDSLAPIIDALRSDIVHSLSTIAPK